MRRVRVSRRRFLGTTGSVGAGLMITAIVPTQSFARQLLSQTGAAPVALAPRTPPTDVDAYLHLGTDGKVTIPPNARIINAEGKTILPGFIDTQAQGNWEWQPPLWLYFGVTTVYYNGTPYMYAEKELQEQGKLAAIDAMRKQQEAEQQFQALKTHYDAGIAAITQMKAAQTKLAQAPKDQQDSVKAEITTAGGTAVTELSAALDLEKPEDPNRPIVLSRLGEAYENAGKFDLATQRFQKAIEVGTKTGDPNLDQYRQHVTRVTAEANTAAEKAAGRK